MTHEVIQITVVGVLAVLMCVSSSDYAGLSFNLTRSDDDKFKNPIAAACDWQSKHQKFCKDTNSRCDKDCCQCTCDYQTSTFDSSNMKCQTNNEFRKGCKVKFVGKYSGHQIKTLDLQAKNGKEKIYWPREHSMDKVESFSIINIAFYDDGSEVQIKFLNKSGKVNQKENYWEGEIKWDRVSKDYHGQLFKVNISYTIERNLDKRKLDRTDCFVFKSSGSITVTFPSATTSTLSPSTTQESTTVSTALSSTSTAPSSTSAIPFSTSTTSSSTMPSSTEDVITTQPSKPTRGTPNTKRPSGNIPPTLSPRTPTNSVEPPVSTSETIVTTQMKESKKTRKPTEPIDKTAEPSRTEPTVAARNEDSGGGGGGNNAMTVSLAVVGCLLLLGVVILVVVWSRRRSARASQGKEKGAVDANGYAENPVMMSPVEGTKNIVYDNAGVNEEYTSLDMTKVKGKSIYQSLLNEQENVYEQIPANYENISSGSPGLIEGEPIKESFDHAVDAQAQGPSQIYDLPEETDSGTTRKIPGRVHRKPADKTAPEKYDREIPVKTGDDNPKRVSYELENGNAELDYLIILPAVLNYEQPVNEPVPDA